MSEPETRELSVLLTYFENDKGISHSLEAMFIASHAFQLVELNRAETKFKISLRAIGL